MKGKAVFVPYSDVVHMSSSICEKPSTANDVPRGQCTLYVEALIKSNI